MTETIEQLISRLEDRVAYLKVAHVGHTKLKVADLDVLLKHISNLRRALEFYADPANYAPRFGSPGHWGPEYDAEPDGKARSWVRDFGSRARAALRGEQQP